MLRKLPGLRAEQLDQWSASYPVSSAHGKELIMPSWIEKMAWGVPCPTCLAEPDEPCRSLLDPSAELDFNHPTRNRRFHLEQQRRRARERKNPVVRHGRAGRG